jgi:hypothetical protein
MIEVIKPLMMAKIMILNTEMDHGFCVIWKKKIVPKSPIEHPKRHHKVFTEALLQVCLHFQFQEIEVDKVSVCSI